MNLTASSRQTMIPDVQGSIIGTLDSGGTLTKSGYQPFGENPTSSTGSFRYTGRRIDPETGGSASQPSGLYYYRARMYSPTWGRFLQPDPLGYSAGTNLYIYASDDPLNLIDPSGDVNVEYIRLPGGYSNLGSNIADITADAFFNPTGYFTVSGHGSPYSFASPQFVDPNNGSFNVNAFVQNIKANGWDGSEPIIILACRVGQGNIPAQIAAATGVDVIAATGYEIPGLSSIGSTLEGVQSVTMSGSSYAGQFVEFTPSGQQVNPFGAPQGQAVVSMTDQLGVLVPTTVSQTSLAPVPSSSSGGGSTAKSEDTEGDGNTSSTDSQTGPSK
jgi:RHS repeat-associated protein